MASETRVCHDDRLYYLVYPKGDARICTPCPAKDSPCQEKCRTNSFSAPVGLDSLSGDSYGKMTKEDIVNGSLATWVSNGRQNKALSITQLATSNNEVRKSLAGLDINTPGMVQLPVCSPDRAFQSWDTSSMRSSPFYPCDIPPGRGHCGGSTFDNQGSDVSPTVSDCQQLIRNIEGDATTDWTHGIVGQRMIASYGSCRFGIERTGGTGGAVQFRVGGQDVIDVINDSIRQFGGGGRVGAKGVMPCSSTTTSTTVDVA